MSSTASAPDVTLPLTQEISAQSLRFIVADRLLLGIQQAARPVTQDFISTVFFNSGGQIAQTSADMVDESSWYDEPVDLTTTKS